MRPRLKKRRAAQRNRSWAFNVLAPWAIGVGALVSFTADAGQDSARDWNIAPLTARIRASRALEEQQAINFSAAATGELSEVKFTQPLIKEAELSLSGNERAEIGLEENEPHADLKGNTQEFPLVDRKHRGDPSISVHPNLASQSSSIPEGDEDPLLTFSIEGTNGRLAQMPLAPRAAVPGDEIFEFEVPEAIPSTTQKTTAAASPPQTSAVATSPTEAPREARESFDKKLASQSYGENRQEASSTFANERTLHGATPQISRAIALGSSTPAQPDSTPIEVSAFPSATLALSAPEKRSQKNYSAFIKPEKLDREKRCLAEAVYFESRSETETGQAAVAQVVLNRVQRSLSIINLRRRLSKSTPLQSLSIFFRLRRTVAPHHGTLRLDNSCSDSQRGYGGPHLYFRCWPLNTLPHKLCQAALGARINQNGRHWQTYFL